MFYVFIMIRQINKKLFALPLSKKYFLFTNPFLFLRPKKNHDVRTPVLYYPFHCCYQFYS
jgi:hypothetical protein